MRLSIRIIDIMIFLISVQVPDYYEIVKQPMDLNSMLNKIDNEMYQTAREFLDDVDLIWRNALEYNPDSDTTGENY